MTDRKIELAGRIKRQRDWIAAHGGGRAGYWLTYGDDYGDGADAIFDADQTELTAMLAEMADLLECK